jgi:hypothetical protein
MHELACVLMNLQTFVILPFVKSEPFAKSEPYVKSEPEPHFKLMLKSYCNQITQCTYFRERNKQCFPETMFSTCWVFPFKFCLLTAAVLLIIQIDTMTTFAVCIWIDQTESEPFLGLLSVWN